MIVLLTSVLQLLIFFLLNLSVTLWGMLTSPIIMVDLSISPCSLISFYLMYYQMHTHLRVEEMLIPQQKKALEWSFTRVGLCDGKHLGIFHRDYVFPMFHEGLLVIYHEDIMVILKVKLRGLWHPHKAIALGFPHSSASPHSTSNISSKLIFLCSYLFWLQKFLYKESRFTQCAWMFKLQGTPLFCDLYPPKGPRKTAEKFSNFLLL